MSATLVSHLGTGCYDAVAQNAGWLNREGSIVGCLRRLLVVGIFFLQVLTFALTLVVLGSAGVLGEAAFISADDALFLFVLSAASLVGTLALAVVLWSGNRARRRQARELAMLRAPAGAAAPLQQMGQ